MALTLPHNGYDAMVLINQLANHGLVGEIEWTVAQKDGRNYLTAIKANLRGAVEVNKPGHIIGPRKLIVPGPNGGKG